MSLGTRWLNASELTVGATVRDAAGEVGVVEALVVVDAPQVMHNLTIERVATYVVGSGQWVVHNQNLLDMLRELGEEAFNDVLGGRNLLFGQRRAAANYSSHPPVPSILQGQSVLSTAETLASGVGDAEKIADHLRIQYFEWEGNLITVNNRGLATWYAAGLRPVDIELIDPAPTTIQNRLAEPSLRVPRRLEVPDNQIVVSGDRIALTKTRVPADADFVSVVKCPF